MTDSHPSTTQYRYRGGSAIAVEEGLFLNNPDRVVSPSFTFDVNPISGIIARREIGGSRNRIAGYNIATGALQWDTTFVLPSPPSGSPPDFIDANASLAVQHIAACPDGSFKLLASRNYFKNNVFVPVIGFRQFWNLGFDLWSVSSSGAWTFEDRFEPWGTDDYPTGSGAPTFPQIGTGRVAIAVDGTVYSLIPRTEDTSGTNPPVAGFVGEGLSSIHTFDAAAVPTFLAANCDGSLIVCGRNLDGSGGAGLMSLDSDGTVRWTWGAGLTINGASSDAEGNVLAVGTLTGQIGTTAVLLDPEGTPIWGYSYSGVGTTVGVACIMTADRYENVVAIRTASGVVTLATLDDSGVEQDTHIVSSPLQDVSIPIHPPPVWHAGKVEVFGV